ncbi:MAG: hypothetical protein M1592_03115, partial [Candidatus Thermoplasmatota archaeon]|nr:hypothetical protein [Candidatus Thermoplasmatota archaeon]
MKPICPKCQKKTVTSYVRGTHREYVAIGYYCSHCDMMVKQMSIEPPKVFRMDVRDFLSGTKE